LNALIEKIKYERQIAITSIGLDGEEIDQLTRLPKPRITVYPDMLVVTSRLCLKDLDDFYQELETLPIRTPLGEIVIAKIIKSTKILVAGPSLYDDMLTVKKNLKKYGIDLFLVDGAFSRQYNLLATEVFVFCVGASRFRTVDDLYENTKTQLYRFFMEKTSESISGCIPIFLSGWVLEGCKFQVVEEDLDLFDEERIPSNAKYAFVSHSFTTRMARMWLTLEKPIGVILNSPMSLQADLHIVSSMCKKNMEIYCIHPLKPVAICINPTSPYHSGFETAEIQEKLQKLSDLPIINIEKEGA